MRRLKIPKHNWRDTNASFYPKSAPGERDYAVFTPEKKRKLYGKKLRRPQMAKE